MKKIILLLYGAFCFNTSLEAQQCDCPLMKAVGKSDPQTLQQSGNPACKAKGFELSAATLIRQNQLDSALKILEIAALWYKKSGCPATEQLQYNKLQSTVFFLKGHFQQAIDFSLKCLSAAQTVNNKPEQADAYLNIAQIFSRMGQVEKGLEYTRSAIPVIADLPAGTEKTDLLYKAGSRFYFFFQDNNVTSLLDTASIFFNEALELSRDLRYEKGMQVGYNKMNSIFFRQKNYRQALLYTDSSIALARQGIVTSSLAASFGDKGNILMKMGMFREALGWADSCLYYNQQTGFPLLIANAWSLIAEIADSLGDHATAYHALYNEKKITDSLNTAEKVKAVNEVEKKFNQARNEKTIHELSQQKLIYALMGFGGLLIATLIAVYFRQQALRNKQRIMETEQRLNRARMNPHFFFNALTALQRYAMKENDGIALASSLSKFSHIMRETLESTYKEYVTIKQEIQFLREYLEIQKMRFPSMFSYALMVDGEMDPDETLIPSMIIQPFIENSLEHGFAGLDYPGDLRVDFRQEKETVLIEINDNGKGLAESGMRNNEHISRARQIIKDRIYLLNIKLKTKAEFSINNHPDGKGVWVKIRLPLIYNHENTNSG